MAKARAGAKKKSRSHSGNPVGRQPVINAKLVALLAKAIGNGTPIVQACSLGLISRDSYRNWMIRGEGAAKLAAETKKPVPKIDRLYVVLFIEVSKAKAKTIDDALKSIHKAGKKNWQAHAWLLTRLSAAKFADDRQARREDKKLVEQLMKELADLRASRAERDSPVPNVEPAPVPDALPVGSVVEVVNQPNEDKPSAVLHEEAGGTGGDPVQGSP